MYEALHAVERRVRFLRVSYLLSVVLSGVLLVATATVVTTDVALLAALVVPGEGVVLGAAKAVLSTVAALVGIYFVGLPLYRNVSAKRFVGQLDAVLGEESFILSACEYSARVRRGDDSVHEVSPVLLADLGNRASMQVRQVATARLRSVTVLFYLSLVFLLVSAGSLVLAMSYPDQIGAAVTRLIVRREPLKKKEVAVEPGAQPESRPGAILVPACRELTATVSQPRYVGGEVRQIPWNSRLETLSGSTVEVICRTSLEAASLMVIEETEHGSVHHPMELYDSGGDVRFIARLKVRRPTRIRIRGDGTWQDPEGFLELVVREDSPPHVCSLLQPLLSPRLQPSDSVHVLAVAEDDIGVTVVTARFQVVGLDEEFRSYELVRSTGEKHVIVQRDVPVSTFSADPGDNVRLVLSVEDGSGTNEACRSREIQVELTSPFVLQKRATEMLAEARDRTVDLLGAAISLELADRFDREGVDSHGRNLYDHFEKLAAINELMSSASLFKQEDTRRVRTLLGTLEDSLPQDLSAVSNLWRMREYAASVRAELEQHVTVLDGMAEKLLGEHLLHLTTRVQRQLSRLLTLSRDGEAGTHVEATRMRELKRLDRITEEIRLLRARTLPRLPQLFTSTLHGAHEDRFAALSDLTGRLLGNKSPQAGEEWARNLAALSVAVEQATKSVEGAYTQSMTRLSSSFRHAQEEMVQHMEAALDFCKSARRELDRIVDDVEDETRAYLEEEITIEQVQEVAREVEQLWDVAWKFKGQTYLTVDQKQVVEFKDKLKKLSEEVSRVQIEAALANVQDLIALTQSMEFSLGVLELSRDDSLMETSKAELDKVLKARGISQRIAGQLAKLRPERDKLSSLNSEKLSAVAGRLDLLKARVSRLSERANLLQKMFPVLFSRVAPELDQLVETVKQARTSLKALQLKATQGQVVHAQTTLERLLDTMKHSLEKGKGAVALAAGGAQPGLPVEGKTLVASRQHLDRLQELSRSFKEDEGWRRIVDEFLLLLGR